jgi:hypothetical protein
MDQHFLHPFWLLLKRQFVLKGLIVRNNDSNTSSVI